MVALYVFLNTKDSLSGIWFDGVYAILLRYLSWKFFPRQQEFVWWIASHEMPYIAQSDGAHSLLVDTSVGDTG